MISGILRQPMAILGALGLLSLAEDLLQWQDQFQTWIDAWQAFSRPVAMFFFGWLIDLWPWNLPDWVLDYLIAGSIVAISLVRAQVIATYSNYYSYLKLSKSSGLSFNRSMLNNFVIAQFVFIALSPLVILFWPLSIIYCLYLYSFRAQNDFDKNALMVFFESFIWAALLIAINYAWLASG